MHRRCLAASLGSIHDMPLAPPDLSCDNQNHLQVLLNIPYRGKTVPHILTQRESLLYSSTASETRARPVAALIVHKAAECGHKIR